jgi:uncharacterized protein YjhX (UPF0386 family)
MATKRTTHRSSTGTKLYAARNKKGEITDIQTYKRAHSSDLKRVSKEETAAKKTRGKQSADRRSGLAERRTAKRPRRTAK